MNVGALWAQDGGIATAEWAVATAITSVWELVQGGMQRALEAGGGSRQILGASCAHHFFACGIAFRLFIRDA